MCEEIYDKRRRRIRKCPICKRSITYDEFYQSHFDKEILKKWMNNDLSIPCCICCDMIFFLEDSIIIRDNVKEYGDHSLLLYDKRYEKNLKLWIDSMRYDALKEKGFINVK